MKKTKSREKLLKILESSKKAYTAAEIHSKVTDVDLATVYRNLNKFVEAGLVRELRLSKGESMYEINHDGHEHAICSKCGKVRHISIDKSKLQAALNLDDFEVEDIEINIKGFCRD